MPIISTLTTAAASGAGFPVSLRNDVPMGIATATGTAFPVFVLEAQPDPATAALGIRLEILDRTGAQLTSDYTKRRGLSFSVEKNGDGGLQFATNLSALEDGLDDPLLDPTNIVRVHFGDLSQWPYGVCEGVIAAAPPTENETGDYEVQISAPGSGSVLDFGILYPEQEFSNETREFSYTSGLTSSYFIPEQWGTPVSKVIAHSFRMLRWGYPGGFPKAIAMTTSWLWPTSPESESDNQTVLFRGGFNVPTRAKYKFYCGGDDTMRHYVDGSLQRNRPRANWAKTTTYTRTLEAGDHIVSAQVQKLSGGSNAGGYFCAVGRLDNNGHVVQWVYRTRTDNTVFLVKAAENVVIPLPPVGWFPPAVMKQHLAEAAARGVVFHNLIVPTFTDTADSTGVAYTEKGPVEYEIASSGSALKEQIIANGTDMAMLPGFQLASWVKRGFDLRSQVTLNRPKSVSWTARAWDKARTAALTHWEDGWRSTSETTGLETEYGRREMALSGGGIESPEQADVFAASAFTTAGGVEETLQCVVTTADIRNGAPMPFRDFNPADIVLMAVPGGYAPATIMQISGTELEQGEVEFIISGYPV